MDIMPLEDTPKLYLLIRCSQYSPHYSHDLLPMFESVHGVGPWINFQKFADIFESLYHWYN
jgi:hypothetical protein